MGKRGPRRLRGFDWVIVGGCGEVHRRQQTGNSSRCADERCAFCLGSLLLAGGRRPSLSAVGHASSLPQVGAARGPHKER